MAAKIQRIYRPRASTPTGVIIERAAARANATQTEVTVKVPDALGKGIFWPIKPNEAAERLANLTDTIEAMRHDVVSEGNSIVIYFGKHASSGERVTFALNLARRSKTPVIIQGVHRQGRSIRVIITQRSELHRKIPELINARR